MGVAQGLDQASAIMSANIFRDCNVFEVVGLILFPWSNSAAVGLQLWKSCVIWRAHYKSHLTWSPTYLKCLFFVCLCVWVFKCLLMDIIFCDWHYVYMWTKACLGYFFSLSVWSGKCFSEPCTVNMKLLGTLDVNQMPVLELLVAWGRDRGGRKDHIWCRCGFDREKQLMWK